MAKFNENELTEILKEFENSKIINLEFERAIDGKIELDDATITYNYETGFVKIISANCNLNINTTMVCAYEKKDNEVKIDMENIVLKITK